MKNLKALFIAASLMGSSASLSAAIEPTDVLAGLATGVLARAGSFALKDQGKAGNNRALLLAAFIGAAATLAWQTNTPGGSLARGAVQGVTALAVFILTMYIVPTTDEKPEDDYFVSFGKHHNKNTD